ncbi:MAG: NAD(P)/FAD-dependent oxidoreductase [Candidatus Lambdaproteobacteria bacterium]|nr:NAD(P)/FAD-dependent oxidoreductase [Candidatus Lambdaproteobacteria bacterium]
MSVELSKHPTPQAEPPRRYDAIVIGAGINGMYQLIRLRELGLSVRVFEAGGDVGGTWYWNRYPGCRFDSESYTYIYSFSRELLDEWDWSEHFSPQPETLRYCNYVADKFDLRKDIQFNSRIRSAVFDETGDQWELETEDGRRARARYLVMALGPLSAPVMPNIAGIDEFEGESYHTGLWPHQPVDFRGKRVAVIGTGATGVQLITEVAKTVGHLTVFQRRPNWCSPLRNRPIASAEMRQIRARYPEIFARCMASEGGFMHVADPRKALEVSAEEREALFEQLYNTPGFAIWMGNFRDTFTDRAANDTISEFIARKIRERVNDPRLAELLIPKDHGFGMRRVPMESGYYEVYNQDNVKLISTLETPIERITPRGIRHGGTDHEFDMIVYATGFDAMLGSYNRIDIRGIGGQRLKDRWAEGPRTFLGIQTAGFPNMMMLIGPHTGASFCNMPRCGEENVDFVADLIRYTEAQGYTRVQPKPQAEAQWTAHVYKVAERLLISQTDSWFTGINRNIPGRDKRVFLLYGGGAPRYREKCAQVVASNYDELEFA